MACFSSVSQRSTGREVADATRVAPRDLSVSFFCIDRAGRVLWTTPAATADLTKLGALADTGRQESATLAQPWVRRLWAQVPSHPGDRQLRLLLPGLLPRGGLLMWRADRPDRLSVLLWQKAGGATSVDPLWHDILTRVGGATPDGSEAAAA